MACSCALGTFKEEIMSSSYVFVGKATKQTVHEFDQGGNTRKIQATTFLISELFKGLEASEVVVNAEPDFSCGFSFELDKYYVVFATNERWFEHLGLATSGLGTSLCTRTSLFEESSSTISKLRKIRQHIPNLESLTPDFIYNNIWKDETFVWVKKSAELPLTIEQQMNLVKKRLSECQVDSILPKNEFDSTMFFSLGFWEYFPSKVYVSFDLNKNGIPSNFRVNEGMGINKDCDQKAIEFVRTLPNWIAAELEGQKVNTIGGYSVDFDWKKSR